MDVYPDNVGIYVHVDHQAIEVQKKDLANLVEILDMVVNDLVGDLNRTFDVNVVLHEHVGTKTFD